MSLLREMKILKRSPEGKTIPKNSDVSRVPFKYFLKNMAPEMILYSQTIYRKSELPML